MNKKFYVYFMTNKNNEILYIGITNNLERRVLEHRNKLIKGFTEKYNCTKIVHYEEFNYIDKAILREKQIKSWNRKRKNDLINEYNSKWNDLYSS
ncbi:MAG: GIY-YIG nuclease family protein [Elusimicrobiaceae bacterium]|jgi:putative endonuclease|nr:GIY-YIG nuclease family protein [Elusimicrobiaceae bacterium]MBT3954606.1 GIY-YIG nuclease family protein [Elusimicrobiaceae bacterium]MBT4007914.1 GIY-YIG nuclease family protein [Elusimicrobiaceae bacterium]MBT4403160.1 GIY-YIG nuclease family protein [Elusimicrobiaceae bacterium]MBT4439928.1 GIY-YIG nuclease family protein [Elusimicrobiaceae bacterium]